MKNLLKAFLFGIIIFSLILALVFFGILIKCFVSGIKIDHHVLMVAFISGAKGGLVPGVALPIIFSFGGFRPRRPGDR